MPLEATNGTAPYDETTAFTEIDLDVEGSGADVLELDSFGMRPDMQMHGNLRNQAP